MTIDEAITYAMEVAEEQSALYSLCPCPCDGTKDCICLENGKDMGCTKRATEHRQIAEYLTELKELRVKVIQLEKDYEELEEINSKHMLKTDNLLDMVKEDYRTINALKKLLITAMEDMKILYEAGKDEGCYGIDFKWRYADEALKLIGDEMCGKNDND